METQTDVLTLGETMLLLNPHESGPLRHSIDFRKRIGGAESNVAIGLAQLEHRAAWVSRLGEDPHGQYVRDTIRGAGVDTQYVAFDSEAPTGIMFKERRELGESGVFYYRDGSAASRMTPDDLPEQALTNTEYLHLTGITPALSDSCRELVRDAIDRANQHGLTVSFDPNLRFKLWDPPAMRETLLPLIEACDIVLPGIEEGEVLLDTDDPETIAEEFRALGATEVIVKLGAEGAFVASDSVAQRVDAYDVDHIVDPIGAGDGFAAGYLSGRLDGLSPDRATDRATAVGALATTVSGDIEGLPTRSELSQFMNDQTDQLR